MFRASRSPRIANKALFLTCLLALTSFLAGWWQAGAQTATTEARSASGEGLVRLTGHTPRKVKTGMAMRMEHYDPHQKLRLAIFVTPRDLAGQEKLIADLQDKKSPNFHKWVTADEWNARFGPRVEDEQAVVDWAKSQGLTITNRFANRMIVDVEAESGTIEQALNVTINHYRVDDEVDFSNDRDPSIPQHLSGIIGGIFGLNSIERLKPADSRHHEARHPDYVPGPMFSTKISGHGEGDPSKAPWAQERSVGTAGAAHGQGQPAPVSSEGAPNPNPSDELGGINPSNLYSSQGYDLGPLMAVSHCCNVHNDSNGSPADTSIALVTFGGFNYSDYTAFTTYYGMAWNIDAYQIDGAGSPTSTTECQIDVNAPSSSCPGDGLDDEADLDTEWSTAFANSYGSYLDTAHVYVYEGNGNYFSNFFDTWNYVLSDAHAHVISSSYDWTEESFQADDPGWMTGTVDGDAHYIFNALVAAGNTLINSSGDQGSTSGCSNANQVFWPTNDPDFLSAGGTSLSLNYDGSFGSETAWVGGTTLKNCQSNGGGGGGGVSQYFSAPSWQSGITYEEMYDGGNYTVSDQPNRMIPDMSLNATGNFQWDYCTTPACKNTAPDGWATWGGTSIVAPELAGFFVQVNSYLNAIGHICGSAGTSACEPIGNPDPTLYDIGKHAGDTNYEQHYPFYDTNQLCVTNYLTSQNPDLLYFCATDGYDLATGWGSANLLQLAWAFNWWIIPSYGDPSVTFTGPATNTWYNTNQTVSWTVADGTFSGSTTPAPGVAGFTQGWDSLPADPTSEPNGGSGNAFYSGPEYPLGTTGCLAFEANGCSGGVSQGCHTVKVRAWDNQGYANTSTYGPLCYDTVAPNISISNSPASSYYTWVNRGVQVTLSATDPGGDGASGIYKTYYAIDTDACYPGNVGPCSVYSGPFTVSTQGQHYIWYFTEDNAGNFSTETYEWISIDLSTPVTSLGLTGNLSSGVYYSKVTATLSATDSGGSGIAATYYLLDGGVATKYTSPLSVSSAGSHTILYWSVNGAGTTEGINTSSFSIGTEMAPTLTSPSPGSILPGPTVTFAWTTEPGATGYYILAGTTGVGSNNLINSAERTTPSYTSSSIPTNGATIYVRVTTSINGTWVSQDYTYTAATQAAMTSPANNSVLAGPTVTFNWAAATGSAAGYYIQIGSTGVGSSNILSSAERTTPSYTISTMPTNGEPIYVRLITNYGGPWVHTDYTYTAATEAEMTAPAPGSVLAGPSVPFTWAAAAGATGYYLQIGSTGVGSDNIYNSAEKTVTSYTFNGMPTNGETIYVRLITNYGGPWVHIDYTYTAATEAEMTAPAPGSVLAGPSVPFTWAAATGATGYYLQIGSTGVGSDNIYNSAEKTVTSYTFNGMPTNGETIYVRLTTNYGGSWVHIDYTYTAATQASITSPTLASVLPGPVVTFDWSAAAGATGYFIQIGSTGVGADDIYNSAEKTTTSYTTSSIPTNGETIYVRLITNYNGTYVHTDSTYTAASAAVMTSPSPGSVFTGASVPFTWTAATGSITGYYLQIGSTGVGADDIYNSAEKTVTSYTFTHMPTNGETIYVRLTTNFNGNWVHTDYTYTAE